MKLVLVSGRELIKILVKKGFEIKRRKGSHVQLEDNYWKESYSSFTS